MPRAYWALAMAGTILGCATGGARSPSDAAAPMSFAIDGDGLLAGGAPPELLTRLASHPYPYFRAIGIPFAKRVCREFIDRRWVLPQVLVHGDAHLEQFVVTQNAFGLEDFDQVGTGPAVLDLVRFASSIHLACFESSFDCDPQPAVEALLDGYAVGLRSPDAVPTTPAIVAKLRAEGHAEHDDFLRWAESLMMPVASPEREQVLRGWETFVDFITEVTPEKSRADFEVKRFGRLRIGIGSVLADKFLFRVRGPTADPQDDVVLEAKRQGLPSDIPCLSGPSVGGMLRPLVAAARLGRRVPETMGFVPLNADAVAPDHFWVQSWTRGYRELAISDLREQRDVEELAFDAGLQLGTANARLSPEILQAQLRWANLRALGLVRDDVPRLGAQLATEVVEAWTAFRGAGRPRRVAPRPRTAQSAQTPP